jgi:uncharacterized protein GlcG (DUF336 family)
MNSRICQPKRSRINLSISSAFTMIASSIALTVISPSAFADNDGNCSQLPGHSALKAALVAARGTANGGFNLDMWGTIVNRDGVVCAVAFTGTDRGSEWPGSRVISAQKANTANSFSLPDLVLSTANLYSATQPGGSLYGLQHSNPVNTDVAYKGPSSNYGTHNDPMVGSKIGGVNVFGGGLALYRSSDGKLVGAIGVSGDSSCADHNIAWKTRFALNYDNIPGGVGTGGTDNIVYDIVLDAFNHPGSTSGWGHPKCSMAATIIGNSLHLLGNFPVGPSP